MKMENDLGKIIIDTDVIATYDGGGSREINVSLDSGIAMIRDVLRAIE